MREWVPKKLGDIIILHYGKALRTQERVLGNIPVYSSAGITGYHNKALIEDQGIIVGRKGSVGTIYKSTNPFYCIDTAYYITPNSSGCNFEYLYYLLKTIGLHELNEDSAVPGLNRQTAYNQDVLIPSPLEQKAIAAVLSSLDDKIDLLQRQNQTLEKMAETLFRQWFIESESSETVMLKELIEFNPKYALSKGADATYLEMAGLSTSSFNATGYYPRAFTSGTKFANRDTLLARITPCLENGKVTYVHFLKDKEIAWGSTEYIVMRSKKSHPLFAYILARNPIFKEYAENCMDGSSGRQRVNLEHLKEFSINYPDVTTIQQMNDFLESIEPRLIYNARQIQTLQSLRDTLLPKLMNGEVRVKLNTNEILRR